MTARSAQFSNRRRPQWWSALLSLFVAITIALPSSHLCAPWESSSGHSHGSEHAALGHADQDGHDGDHHADNHHADASDDHSSTPPEQHTCCSDSEPLQAVVAAVLRPAAPDQIVVPVNYAVPTQPFVVDVFALTNCHGRDGPPGQILRSQFVPSSLLGRAPPFLV